MRNAQLSRGLVWTLCSIGLLLATNKVQSAEPPEQLKKLAEEIPRFAWSLEIERKVNSDGKTRYERPNVNDFRVIYDEDRNNQRKQTWLGNKQYADWVKKFYSGTPAGFLRPAIAGWVEKTQGVAATNEMTMYVNVLGRVIASEWAKDNGVRKIDSGEVRDWGGKLTTATRNDNDGNKRMSALRSVADLVAAELRNP